MPKAKNRDRDRRGTRFPRGKILNDPWFPVYPIGTILVTTDHIVTYWGGIGPHTKVRVTAHTPATTDGCGPGMLVAPVDPEHPIYRGDKRHHLWKPGYTAKDAAVYVHNREIKTHLRPE